MDNPAIAYRLLLLSNSNKFQFTSEIRHRCESDWLETFSERTYIDSAVYPDPDAITMSIIFFSNKYLITNIEQTLVIKEQLMQLAIAKLNQLMVTSSNLKQILVKELSNG